MCWDDLTHLLKLIKLLWAKKTDCLRNQYLGRGSRTRTHGTWFWRPMFYQLNYTPTTDYIIPNFSRLVKQIIEFIKISVINNNINIYTCY